MQRLHPVPSCRSRRAVTLGAALLGALALAPSHAQERDVDTRAPVIEIETLDDGVAGRTQTFSVRATDDDGLDSVSLHHRREGERPFERVPMRALGADGEFGTTLSTDPDDLRPIEYYVQALDRSGNRTVSGFAFDPLRRTLRAPVDALADGSPATAAPAPAERSPAGGSGRVRWWAVALGVLAVGTAASLAASDGGGGGDTVPLTVDLPEPSSR